MPRTAITPQAATAAGTAIVFEPANVLGNSFTPARGRVLLVKNGSGSSITVTLPTPATSDGLAVADRTVTVAAAAESPIALGSPAVSGIYAQADGSAYVDYSSVTSVTVAVLTVP